MEALIVNLTAWEDRHGAPVAAATAPLKPYRLKSWSKARNICTPVALLRLLAPAADDRLAQDLIAQLLPLARRRGWLPPIGTFFFTVHPMARAFGRALKVSVKPQTRLAGFIFFRKACQRLIRGQLNRSHGLVLSTVIGPWRRHSLVICSYRAYADGAFLIQVQDGWQAAPQWVDFATLCRRTPLSVTALYA